MKKGKRQRTSDTCITTLLIRIYLRQKIDEIKKIKEDLNQARVELESGNVYIHFGMGALH